MKRKALPLIALCCACAAHAAPAPFTPGNLAILRFGEGASALTNAGTAIFIDEYTTAGSLAQSIAIPTSGGTIPAGFGAAPTLSGPAPAAQSVLAVWWWIGAGPIQWFLQPHPRA